MVEVKETFIDFLETNNKSAEGVANVILKKLSDDGLDIADCRGQGYDNAATMAGIHTGVQSRIKDVNPKAEFIPCNNHTLNLAGVNASSASVNSVTFFDTVEKIFTFFSSSTHRWEVLMNHINKTVKRVIETRWSVKHDAVDAINSNYEELIEALQEMTDSKETADTRSDANILLNSLMTFLFLCYLWLWSTVLPEVDKVQNFLQTKRLSLDQTTASIQSLYRYLNDNRDELVASTMRTTTEKCVEMNIPTTRCIRRRRRMDSEESRDVGLSLEEEIKRELFEVVDRLRDEIHRRFQ